MWFYNTLLYSYTTIIITITNILLFDFNYYFIALLMAILHHYYVKVQLWSSFVTPIG